MKHPALKAALERAELCDLWVQRDHTEYYGKTHLRIIWMGEEVSEVLYEGVLVTGDSGKHAEIINKCCDVMDQLEGKSEEVLKCA